MKPLNVITFILITLLMSGVVFAADSNGQGSSPFFNADYDSNSTRDLQSLIGQDKFPLVCNLDSDNDNEIITYEGNIIYVYNLGSSGVTLTSSFNVGKSIKAVDCVVSVFDPDQTDYEVLVVTADDVRGYGLSGGALGLSNTYYTFSSSIPSSSETFCTSWTYGASDENVDFYCAFAANGQMYRISSGTRTDNGFDSFNFTRAVDQANNVIYDVPNELLYFSSSDDVYSCDVSQYRINNITPPCSIIDTPTNLNSAANPLQGFTSVSGVVACQIYDDKLSSYGDIENVCYFNNQTVINKPIITAIASTTNAYDVFLYDINIDGAVDACFNYLDANGVKTTKCYDLGNNEIVGVSQNTNGFLRGIGNVKEIDNPYFIYYDDVNNEIDFIDIDNSSNFETVAQDDDRLFLLHRLDTDNTQEVIGESNTGIVVYYSSASVVDTITVNDSLQYSGIYGFYDPTCTNTQFNFKAKECTDTEECTYTNENPDPYVREKICTTCGGATAYHCGDWSYTEPQVNCSFSSTGTKNIDIQLFTDTNPSLLAYVFDTFSMEVAATNCDQSEDLIGVPSPDDPTTPTETTEEKSAAEIFLDNVLTIIALIVITGFMCFLYFSGVKNFGIIAFGGFVMTIIMSMFGTISFMIAVFIVLGMLVIALLGLFFTRIGSNN